MITKDQLLYFSRRAYLRSSSVKSRLLFLTDPVTDRLHVNFVQHFYSLTDDFRQTTMADQKVSDPIFLHEDHLG